MDDNFKNDLKKVSKKLKVKHRVSEERLNFEYHNYPLVHNQAIYVMSLRNQQLIYQRNILDLLGYHESEFNYDSLFSLVHPADYPVVRKIVSSTLQYSAEHGMSDDAVLYLTYRLKAKNGGYIKVQRASGVCNLADDNTLKGNYSIIQDISYMGLSDAVRWHWDSPLIEKSAYRKYVNVSPVDFFTKRELQVFELLRIGMNSKEIASELKITHHTVTSHRKSMLKKASCRNIFELLQYFESGSLYKS